MSFMVMYVDNLLLFVILLLAFSMEVKDLNHQEQLKYVLLWLLTDISHLTEVRNILFLLKNYGLLLAKTVRWQEGCSFSPLQPSFFRSWIMSENWKLYVYKVLFNWCKVYFNVLYSFWSKDPQKVTMKRELIRYRRAETNCCKKIIINLQRRLKSVTTLSGKLRHGPQLFTQKKEGGGLSLSAFALER